MNKNTYYPEYVHSELKNGQFKMRVTISNENFYDENIKVATQFCQDWIADKYQTFINVEFDMQHIIDDALYSDRYKRTAFKFKGKEDLRYLRKLQSDLMKALSRVNTAIAGTKYVFVNDKGEVQE